MLTALRHLWRLFGDRRGRWYLLVLLVLLTSATEALAAATVFALVRLLSTGQVDVPGLRTATVDGGDLPVLAALTIGVFLARAALVVVHDRVLYRLCYGAGAEVEAGLLRGYLTLPPRQIRARGHAQLVRNVHDTVMTVVEEGLIPAVLAVGAVLQTVALATVMLAVAPLPTLAAAAFFAPVLWLIARGLRAPARRLGEQAEAALGDSLQVATETLELAADIRAAGRSEVFGDRFVAVRRELARAGGTEEVLRALPRLAGETALVLFVLGYVAVATVRGGAAEVLPTIGLFAYAALRILPSLLGLVGTAHSMALAGPALAVVVGDEHLLRAGRRPPGAGATPRVLQLHGAVVRVPGTDRAVLDGVDLRLCRGDVVAVVGPNGAGKSTLVDVLAGVLPLDAGEVRADGRLLAELEDSWPGQVAMVPQQVRLMDADIAVNVTLDPSGRSSDDPRVGEVLRAVGLGPVVERLAGTSVGEDGSSLSGGERQRVVVARALYRSAGVLLIDEGTSALDPTSRDAFVALLGRRSEDRITVLVTHDPELAAACSRVVRVEGGRLHETAVAAPTAPLATAGRDGAR